MRQKSATGPHRAMLRRGSAAYSAEDLVDDAAAVLDALDWPAAHVFGLSVESSRNAWPCGTPDRTRRTRRRLQPRAGGPAGVLDRPISRRGIGGAGRVRP